MALILPGFALQAQEEAAVSPNPLKVIGDSVYFTVDVNLPAKNKYGNSGTLQVRPFLGDF